MDLGGVYRWEAERPDGTVISEPTAAEAKDIDRAAFPEVSGDLRGCARFSLVPTVPGRRRIDLPGEPLVRRFGRRFLRAWGPKLPEYLQVIVCEDYRLYVRCSDGAMVVTPPDYELYL